MSNNLSADAWMEESSKGNEITTAELDERCIAWAKAREEYEQAKQEATDLYNESERLKGKVVEAMELAGKNKYVVEGFGTFGFKDSMSVKTPKTIAEKKQFFAFIMEKYGVS